MSKLNPEMIRPILATAEKFAERELKKTARERDAYPYAAFPAGLIQAAGDAGLLHLSAPEDVCGAGCGLPTEAWALVLEKLAETDAGFAAALMAHALAEEAVLRLGSEKIQREWIGAEPSRWLSYPLYLEAGAAEDLPIARKKDKTYLLTGAARLMANGPIADAAVVAANLEDRPALFLVPLGPDSRPEPTETLGLRSCPVGHLDLAAAVLPADHLLARGEAAIRELHELFYPSAAAILVATIKASLDYAVEYGKERHQGGKMISEHSQLRMMYGRMAVERLALRQAMLRVIEEEAEPGSRLAVKALAAELAVRATIDGVQLLGGYGYTMEYPQERRMRDARQAAELLGSATRERLSLVENLTPGK